MFIQYIYPNSREKYSVDLADVLGLIDEIKCGAYETQEDALHALLGMSTLISPANVGKNYGSLGSLLNRSLFKGRKK